MKKTICLLILVAIAYGTVAQDEGSIDVKSRFERNKSVYVSFGPALTLGKNLGDYSAGLNLEAGLVKRLNKVFSIGPNVSYLSFKYDTDKTYPHYYSAFDDRIIEFAMEGGDVSLLSVGCNVKLNIVPVSNATVVSVYGIGNPFISSVKRKAFTGSGDFYGDGNGDGNYTDFLGSVNFGFEEVAAFKEESKLTGGVHLGIGAEFTPTKVLSFFAQATFSYTLPISYAATESFLKSEDEFKDSNGTVYYNADNTVFTESFPIVKNGFSTLCIKAGLSFNF